MSGVPESKPARCRHSHAEEDDKSSRRTDRGKIPARNPPKTPSQVSSSSSLRRGGSKASVQHSDDGRSSVASDKSSQKQLSTRSSITDSLSIDEVTDDGASRRSSDRRSESGESRGRAPSVAYSTDPDLSSSTSTLQRDADGRSMGSDSLYSSQGAPHSEASSYSVRSTTSDGTRKEVGSERDGSRLPSARGSSRQSDVFENGSGQYTYSDAGDEEDEEAPPGDDANTAAVFTPFIHALQEETQRLNNTENLDKFESAHVRGILGELTDTLRDTEDQSLRLFEGIEAIREAAQGLRRTLEARLNRSTEAEAEAMVEGQENTDNKKAHSRAVAAVSAAKALLAEVALDVTTATRMAAEAQTAAAEAAAAAEDAAEEIGEIEATLEQAGTGEGEAGVEEELEEEGDERGEVDGGVEGGDDDDDDDDDDGEVDEDARSSRSSLTSSSRRGEEEIDEEVDEDLQSKDDGEGRDDGDKEGGSDDDGEEKEEERKEETPKPPSSPKRPRSVRENMLEWPYHILNLPNDDATDEEIGCIVRFKEEYYTASPPEFRCVVNNHMSADAVGDSEELVSHVVTVELADDEAPGESQLDVPIVVAVPYGASARMLSTREFVVKFKGGNEEEWRVVRVLLVDGSFAEHKGPFAEVRTSQLGSFVVVARLINDRQTITKKGGVIKSSSDSRMSVCYPPGVCSLMSVTLQVQPAEHAVSDLRARMRHCSDLIAASPIITLSHSPDKPFEKPVTVTIPCPPNPLKVSAAANTTSTAAAPTAKSSAEKQGPLSPDGAVIIRGTKSSIFGGDPSEDTLLLMHRQSNWSSWNEVENAEFKQVRKDLVSIELDKPLDKLLILRMTSDGRYPAKNVAQTFERALQIKYATIVLQHREEDPQHVVVQCVSTRQLESALRRLSQEGYEGHPPDPSPNIAMTEGQEITMRFTGNIKIVGRDQITFTFHSQRRNLVEFTVEETNKYGNHSSDEYRGMAEFYGTPRIALTDMEDPEEVLLRDAEAKAAEKGSKHSGSSMLTKSEKKKQQEALDGTGRDYQSLRKVEPDLICKIPVSLPKADPEPPLPPSRYRTTAIDAGGSVSNINLRWLSSELGNEWESLAVLLGIKRSRLQSIKRNNPIKVEQQVLDMLVTWRSMLPRAYDKERKLCRALVRCGRYDLAEELKERDSMSTETGTTSNLNNLNVLDIDDY